MMERVILGSIGKAARLATDHSCLIIIPTSNSFERINNFVFLKFLGISFIPVPSWVWN
jgi:hypothetical protein